MMKMIMVTLVLLMLVQVPAIYGEERLLLFPLHRTPFRKFHHALAPLCKFYFTCNL
ncbi:unnamed protein product [Prunus brigantina]